MEAKRGNLLLSGLEEMSTTGLTGQEKLIINDNNRKINNTRSFSTQSSDANDKSIL